MDYKWYSYEDPFFQMSLGICNNNIKRLVGLFSMLKPIEGADLIIKKTSLFTLLLLWRLILCLFFCLLGENMVSE